MTLPGSAFNEGSSRKWTHRNFSAIFITTLPSSYQQALKVKQWQTNPSAYSVTYSSLSCSVRLRFQWPRKSLKDWKGMITPLLHADGLEEPMHAYFHFMKRTLLHWLYYHARVIHVWSRRSVSSNNHSERISLSFAIPGGFWLRPSWDTFLCKWPMLI